MTMVKSLHDLLRKKATAKGVYSEVWDCFFKSLENEGLLSTSVTLNLYNMYPSFSNRWIEIVDEETGEIISPEELDTKEMSQEEKSERFTRIYNPMKYEQEIKYLQSLGKELEKEGFSVFVGFDSSYKKSFSYPPYITLNW